MKRLSLLFLLCLMSFMVYGETVLIFTRNSLDTKIPGVMEMQSALEDGVMETFFDAGHIVFNAGVVTENKKLDTPSERLSFRMAKNGGALFLLEIDLSYDDPRDSEKKPTMSAVQYRFYNVETGDLLTEGSLGPEDIKNDPAASEDDICIAMGESIASGALAKLRL